MKAALLPALFALSALEHENEYCESGNRTMARVRGLMFNGTLTYPISDRLVATIGVCDLVDLLSHALNAQSE